MSAQSRSGAASRHISFRIPQELYGRLTRFTAKLRGATRTSLATELLDEGLRMREHPGVIFVPGPAGRRPRVVGGPDVWVVARVLRDALPGEEGILRTAEMMDLPINQVRSAARYYSSFKDEIDGWIGSLDEMADELGVAATG